ncbi:MAG: PEP-CTERM sorting domain-containing protein [Burkholderiales bacterium]|nr:PEP-CTERM sorting domain-containing protein [Burkholderiales bacterium]
MSFQSLCIAALAAAAGLQAVPASAAQRLSYGGDCSKVVGGSLPFDASFNPSCPGGMWADARPGTTNQASWTAAANSGLLASSASVSLSSLAPLGASVPLSFGVSAGSFALAWDDLTIEAPGLAGQKGRFIGSVRVDGLMGSAASSSVASTYASWGIEAQVVQNGRRTGYNAISGEYRYALGTTSGSPAVDQALLSIDAEVVFGSPFLLAMQLHTFASATVRPDGAPGTPGYLLPVTATAASNFANTALWNGLQSVVLLDGSEVQGWSVSSASGLDYSRPVMPPVPEASTLAMLMLGLVLVGASARRRHPG